MKMKIISKILTGEDIFAAKAAEVVNDVKSVVLPAVIKVFSSLSPLSFIPMFEWNVLIKIKTSSTP